MAWFLYRTRIESETLVSHPSLHRIALFRHHIALAPLVRYDVGRVLTIEKLTKSQFCANSHRFRDINIKQIWSSKRKSSSWCTIFAKTSFVGKSQNLQMSPTYFFYASSYRFTNITVRNVVKATENIFCNKCSVPNNMLNYNALYNQILLNKSICSYINIA